MVCMNQVGKGNIAVVSPPGIYENIVHPDGQTAPGGNLSGGQAPPEYTHGLEDNSFSDAAIRRGEGGKKGRNGWREK